MQDLVPIKVKIGLRSNGHADHPDWYKLPLAKEMEPATQMSDGWHYDKTSGHKESSADSPKGMQWGLLFVTPRFAKEAIQVFPTLITELTEVEAKDFYENKCTINQPENKIDINILQGLQVELSLRESLGQDTTILKAKITKALDPLDKEVGLRKNMTKNFDDYKSIRTINIVKSQ